MDTPEQPTIWPPAPTLPPPEAEKREPFKLPLPGWIAVTLKETTALTLLFFGMLTAFDWFLTHQLRLLRWKEYVLMTLAWLILYGIKNWRKFHPKA